MLIKIVSYNNSKVVYRVNPYKYDGTSDYARQYGELIAVKFAGHRSWTLRRYGNIEKGHLDSIELHPDFVSES